jgi:hypothetical protein
MSKPGQRPPNRKLAPDSKWNVFSRPVHRNRPRAEVISFDEDSRKYVSLPEMEKIHFEAVKSVFFIFLPCSCTKFSQSCIFLLIINTYIILYYLIAREFLGGFRKRKNQRREIAKTQAQKIVMDQKREEKEEVHISSS